MSKTKTRRRRRKRSFMLYYIAAGLLIAVVSLVLWLVLRKGYETYVHSTYRLEHQDIVMQASEDFDISPSLIYGIIRTESGFDEQALSSADAKGLMQVTDGTLEWLQLRSDEFDDVTPAQLFEPEINIRCGTYLLKLLFEQFEDEATVIAAYNAGLGHVGEWLQNSAYSADGKTLHTIPFGETDNYVERVLDSKAIYQEYYHLEGD